MNTPEYQRKWAHENPEKRAEYTRRYRAKNREKYIEGLRKWKAKNPSYHTTYMRGWREKNREQWTKYMSGFRYRRRKLVIDHYGGKCACCGETTWEFLSIDHVNGGGVKHKKEIGGASVLVGWIIKNNFPDDFEVLCHNCNQAKGYYGICPHQRVE